MKTQRQLWSEICDLLSLSQYTKTMGGDMRYVSKALKAKTASKSKRVHQLADDIIFAANLESITYADILEFRANKTGGA